MKSTRTVRSAGEDDIRPRPGLAHALVAWRILAVGVPVLALDAALQTALQAID